MDLLECEDNDGREESSDAWSNLIDRGGLWYVSDATFMVFQSVEEVVRQQLRP